MACFDAGKDTARLQQLAPLASVSESWEVLLGESVADGLLIASRPIDPAAREARSEQLRKLVQASVPLIAVHPICEMIVALELEMIQRDTGCPIVVYDAQANDAVMRGIVDQIQGRDR